jgi:hypothetical protein
MRKRRRFGPVVAVTVIGLLSPFLMIGQAGGAPTRPAAPVGSWCTTSAVSGWPLTCPIEGPAVDNSSDTAAHGELSRLCEPDGSLALPTSAPLPPGDGSTTELPPAFTFLGLGLNDNKGNTGELATDASGAAGKNHYVQTINDVAAVYNKLGQRLCPPFSAGSWWEKTNPGAHWDDPNSPGARACSVIDSTDAIVMYDTAADRWFASHFASGKENANAPQDPANTAPTSFWQCVAVSRGSDPTGAYALYAFRTSPFPDGFSYQNFLFADYPKFGIWPNEYVMNARYRCPAPGDRPGVGAGMMAFDRQKMLADESDASAVIFFQPFPINPGDALPCDSGYQPALQSTRSAVDVDGAATPPFGTPGYFLHYVTQGPGCDSAAPLLRLDTLAVDWATPSAAQYVDGAAEFPIDGWSAAGGVTTPTGNVPNVCFAPMNRSVYRNFGDHESIVANHSVGTPTSSAPQIRWYDLQRQASGPWQFAQPPETFALASGSSAPIGIGLGSIAMDHGGDIALGYVFGSQDVPQSVGAAARLSTDMASSLPRVGVLQHGSAANKEASLHVDYTQMTVDPVDDCTFWYVGSFAPPPPDTGTNPFKTSISAFKLPGCGAPSAVSVAPTFTG